MIKTDETITQRLMLSLWSNWAITTLCFIAVLCTSFFLNKMITPLAVAFMAFLLLNYSTRLRSGSTPRCVLIIRIGMLSLFWTAVIMTCINFLNSRIMFNGIINWSKSSQDIPYINSLVLFPVISMVCIWEMIRGYNAGFCRRCRLHTGLSRITNVITAIYSRESRYQMQLLLCLSLAMSTIGWWYYVSYYINVNLNTPDRFFFSYMPIALMLFSLFFIRVRYSNMAAMVGPLTHVKKGVAQIARVIIISGDYILLATRSGGRWDTPISFHLNSNKDEDIRTQVEQGFQQVANLDNADLRYLYINKSYDMVSNVYHYAALLPDGQENGTLPGKWFSLEMLDTLIRTTKISTEMADEIYRIYTITMAWKTYDRNGKRLYPIKQYRPSFKLRDFKEWDVDYDDASWFDIADNNEDSKFWNTRRFWKRITR